MNKGLHAVRVKRFSALAPPPLGTVLYLPGLPGFGSTIIDRSGKENHGAITGATWTRLPSGLWYLNFDGTDDWIALSGALASISKDLDFSVSLWANYPTGGGGGLAFNTLAGGDRFEMLIISDLVRVNVWNGVAYTGKEGAITTGWHHIGYTYTTATSAHALFIDNVAKTDAAADAGYNSATVGCRFGANTGGTTDLTGGIALIKVHSRVLSAIEWSSIFSQERRLVGV